MKTHTNKRGSTKITVNAPAKINLYLDILGKRDDGYHNVEMVMQAVSLYDTVSVTRAKHGFVNLTSSIPIPGSLKSNTAYLAAEAFFEHANIFNPGLDIHIKKQIPICAGLAGGSSDAAAVLIALNSLFSANFSKKELAFIGEKIGADVPFCLYGGTMLATNTGTILKPLPSIPRCFLVIVKPNVAISTKVAYEASDMCAARKNSSITNVISALNNCDLRALSGSLYNRFEDVLQIDEIEKIKHWLTQLGSLNACMSGSGSAVFGLFESKQPAVKCKDILGECYNDVFLVEPVESI